MKLKRPELQLTAASRQAAAFADGTMKSAEERTYLFGPKRLAALTGLSPEEKEEIKLLLYRRKVKQMDLPLLIRGIAGMAEDAASELTAHGKSNDAVWKAKEAGLEFVLKHTRLFPPRELTYATSEQHREWPDTILQMTVDSIERNRWEDILEILEGAWWAALYNRQDGGFHQGHTLERIVRHYSTPENRKYSPGHAGDDLNPRRISIECDAKRIREYPATCLAANAKSREPLDPLRFAKHMLRPYANQELLKGLEQWEPGWEQGQEYDTKEAFKETYLTLNSAPSTAPEDHSRTSYQRYYVAGLHQNRITSLIAKGDTNGFGPNLMAFIIALEHTETVLHRMALLQHNGRRPKDNGFQAPLHWNDGINRNWRQTAELTENFTVTVNLALMIDQHQEHVRRNFDSLYATQTRNKWAEALQNEAMWDLSIAGRKLVEVEMTRMEKQQEQDAEELLSDAAGEENPSPAVAAMLEALQARKNLAARRRSPRPQNLRSGLNPYGQTKRAIAEKLRAEELPDRSAAKFDPDQLPEDERETALFHQVICHLTHADYLLTGIRKLNETAG